MKDGPYGATFYSINFSKESLEYDTLKRMAESKGIKLSDYCQEILLEHVRSSNA